LFGDLVRVHRRRLGLTQDELAGRAGVGVRSIRGIEAGQLTALAFDSRSRPAVVISAIAGTAGVGKTNS
jgi:transcriptional regulator with XRE-family HTH domain